MITDRKYNDKPYSSPYLNKPVRSLGEYQSELKRNPRRKVTKKKVKK